MNFKAVVLIWTCVILHVDSPAAINFGPFGPHGEGGTRNGQDFRIGTGATVYELDSFLYIGGQDLNGPEQGTAAQLSRHPLPPGLQFKFSSVLASTNQEVLLTYVFSNANATAFNDVRFFALLDTEIAETKNTFFNEYGEMSGVLRAGTNSGPDVWQIDEPGFAGGSLLRNLLNGALSNSNAAPQNAANDVALGLGFFLGNVQTQSAVTVRVQISEIGTSLGSLALRHRDTALDSPSHVTFSGFSDVKEPPLANVNALLAFTNQWRLNRTTGALIGTLRLTNSAANTVPLGMPCRFLMHASTNFFFVRTDGTHNGLPYVELTPFLTPQMGTGGAFDPGETAMVDGIEVYSRDRSPPPNSLFEVWAVPLK